MATPSFSVDSPKTRLKRVSSTCIDSITAITATGSTADAKAAKVRSYALEKDEINALDDAMYRPPMMNVEINVPTTA